MSDNGFIFGYAIVLVLLLLLISVSCAPVKLNPWDYPRDLVGNVWPAECRRDLQVLTATIKIYPASRANLNGANGLFFSFGDIDDNGVLNGVILIADDMTGFGFEDTLHHERCHAVAGLAWHK